MKCKTKAWLHREYARVLDMCEGTNVYTFNCIKCFGKIMEHAPIFDSVPEKYDFAIAIVEDKPVFIGDTLYGYIDGKPWIVNESWSVEWGGLTWNPQKKKTFTLNGKELPLPDDEYMHILRISNKNYWFKTPEDRRIVRDAIYHLLDGE